MNQQDKIKELLYQSFEQELSAEEHAMLSAALKDDPKLRLDYERLKEIRKALSAYYPGPSPSFVEKVMAAIPESKRKEPSLVFLLGKTLPRVAAAVALVLAAALAAIYFSEGGFSMDALLGTEVLTPEEALTILID
jgi:anti-sigma factor RsiW